MELSSAEKSSLQYEDTSADGSIYICNWDQMGSNVSIYSLGVNQVRSE